ncbi:hypothetical protein [Mycobacteroides salmoniphilum]|uniref:Uncharacterized protein n=1 Tax=Mycobacteroides salmoniphilum TaxID=404941 RepID=A0A4R8T087_9MYCO|nr:hypothetical protein [Mycobacteroides salmoniphilum]TEA09231.1 hypothetical protein CCUG60884_00221 [Mycobacteroides salmoniphilum]
MTRQLMIFLAAAVTAAVALILVLVVVVVSAGQQQRTTRKAAAACSAALGIPATPGTTVTELAGPQAAALLGPQDTGDNAAAAVATLYQISNWRDLDPAAVSRWVRQPGTEQLPEGATLSTAPNSPAAQADSYETRCDKIVSSLTAAQMNNAIAATLLNADGSPEGLRAASAAESVLGQQMTQQAFLTHILTAAFPEEPVIGTPTPATLLWRGTQVAPAAATRGDLVIFDYNRTGPTQVAITLNPTTVAATTGLDSPANPPGAIVTGHPPGQNITVIRLTSTNPSPTTERPTQP